jgi:putative oxidoreductase
MDIGLFLLHVVVGLLLFGHGAQKLFGWFGGQGIGGAGEFMQSLGLRPGRFHAVAGGVGEVVGGLLIALGLFLPFAAALVIAVMVTATVAVHWRNGLWAQNGGYEYPLTNIAIAVALAGAGAGELSLDAALGLDLTGAGWALGALAVGVGGGVGAILQGRLSARSASDTQAQGA